MTPKLQDPPLERPHSDDALVDRKVDDAIGSNGRRSEPEDPRAVCLEIAEEIERGRGRARGREGGSGRREG